MRLLLSTALAGASVGAVVWSAIGMMTVSHSLSAGASRVAPELSLVERAPTHSAPIPKLAEVEAQRMIAARIAGVSEKSDRLTTASLNASVARTGAKADVAHFDAGAKDAPVAVAKLDHLAGHGVSGKASGKAKAPAPERFAMLAPAADHQPILLAYAEASPRRADAALSALLSTPVENGLATLLDPENDIDNESPAEYGDIPSTAPLPEFRPQGDLPGSVPAETRKPEPRQSEATPIAGEKRQSTASQAADQDRVAYARPDNPTAQNGGVGRTLRNLFGGRKAAGTRNDVAVYDISAARVYMPDGSVLEAHSGIGKMADDPRYVHVRMNGPTPPHTYNLRMREKRFHGVEAIRMLPVDGKNKHGRDGFLTHSYLLRGGRAESHGCVAFKDYDRFLNAFKQGKVRQLIVVPSGGQATMLASNGRY